VNPEEEKREGCGGKDSHDAQALKTTEAGWQRGTNTYQCWPPLQLNDTNTGAQIHKKHKKEKKEKKQLVYKLKRVDVQKKISY